MKKRIRHLAMTFFVAFAFTSSVFAQEAIKGTLRSTTGEPLSGASVAIKGTNNSVVTNSKGEFSINAPARSVLIISLYGIFSFSA